MKINFTVKLVGLDGQPVLEKDTDGQTKMVTLATVAVNALLAPLVDMRGQPEQLDGLTKVRHATLAESIFKATDAVDLKVEDIALIKERIGRAFAPLVVMRAWALLEGDAG